MATPQLALHLTVLANTIFYVLPKPLKREQTWADITGQLHTLKIYEQSSHQLCKGKRALLTLFSLWVASDM
jgi:hypothetical protein